MKPADDIRRLFENAELTTHPQTHEKVFQDVLEAQRTNPVPSPAQPERWRFVMRHPITRYSVAALIVLAAIVGLTVFKGTGNVAWAIEQSIEAVSKYRAVLVEGSDSQRSWTEDGSSEPRPSRSWAVANADQTRVEKYRMEVDGVAILVTNGTTTWRYDPESNTVRVENYPYVASELWLGSQLLEQLKEYRDAGVITQWQESYDQDVETGQPQVVVNIAWQDERWNGPRSVRLTLDRRTKLLISFEQWENAAWQGPATLVVAKITYYESLPDDLFVLDTPPGATVVEE